MKFFISAILLVLFLASPLLYAENNNRVVAFVNDDLITLYELNKKIEEMTGRTCEELKSVNEQEFFTIRDAVLDRMITDKLAWEKVKELELVPTKGQIDSYIENIKEHNKWTQEDLLEQLKNQGLTIQKFRTQLTEELGGRTLVDMEVREKTVITDEQIAEYYEANKAEYEKPGKAHIASIFLVPESSGDEINTDKLREKGNHIIERLNNGEDFADLAREFSNGPGANEGGDLGNILLADVDPKILAVINSLENGEVSSLIDMGNRFQIIKLINKTETAWVPLEEVRNAINELLYNKEIEKRYDKYMEALKKDSYIKKIL